MKSRILFLLLLASCGEQSDKSVNYKKVVQIVSKSIPFQATYKYNDKENIKVMGQLKYNLDHSLENKIPLTMGLLTKSLSLSMKDYNIESFGEIKSIQLISENNFNNIQDVSYTQNLNNNDLILNLDNLKSKLDQANRLHLLLKTVKRKTHLYVKFRQAPRLEATILKNEQSSPLAQTQKEIKISHKVFNLMSIIRLRNTTSEHLTIDLKMKDRKLLFNTNIQSFHIQLNECSYVKTTQLKTMVKDNYFILPITKQSHQAISALYSKSDHIKFNLNMGPREVVELGVYVLNTHNIAKLAGGEKIMSPYQTWQLANSCTDKCGAQHHLYRVPNIKNEVIGENIALTELDLRGVISFKYKNEYRNFIKESSLNKKQILKKEQAVPGPNILKKYKATRVIKKDACRPPSRPYRPPPCEPQCL